MIPPLRPDVLIEFSHRLAALRSVLHRGHRSCVTLRAPAPPALRRLALALPALLAAQIALGGITVLLKLPDLVSTAHLVNAPADPGRSHPARPRAPGRRGHPRRRRAKLARLARVGLSCSWSSSRWAATCATPGAGLACPDFPLCSGDLLPSALAGRRALGAPLARRAPARPLHPRGSARPDRGRAAWSPALAVLQVALGIATVLLQLAPVVRAAHAAIGYALWAVLVWVSVRGGMLARESAPRPPGRA